METFDTHKKTKDKDEAKIFPLGPGTSVELSNIYIYIYVYINVCDYARVYMYIWQLGWTFIKTDFFFYLLR
jgi:hypothetical protein